MADLMRPIPFSELLLRIAGEYKNHDSIFSINKDQFYKDKEKHFVDVFNQKYNDNLLEKDIIKELIMDGYLEVFSGNIRCNYKYIYLLNNILERIMGRDL